MTELLFILTIIFVVYVVYAVFGDKPTSSPRFIRPTTTPPPISPNTTPTSTMTPELPAVTLITSTPTNTTPSTPEKLPLPASAVKILHNPKTGETAPVPNNYRFAKRWIKDALVSEGLLDKVYRNNELDDAANAEKVREALERLKALPAYQGG